MFDFVIVPLLTADMKRNLFVFVWILIDQISLCSYNFANLKCCPGNEAHIALDGKPALDNVGREFIIAFMDNHGASNDDLEVYVMSSTGDETHVNVSSPKFSNPAINEQITLNGQSFQILKLSGNLRLTESELASKALLIQSDRDITVHGFNFKSFSSDGFLALPLDVLGSEYYTVTYFPPTLKCQIMVVGIYDVTNVTITLSNNINSENVSYNGTTYGKGEQISVTLDRYDCIQLQSSGDLTGTFVSSDKHVAVFSGNYKTKAGDSGTSRDHLVIQLTPVDTWGKVFATAPTPLRKCGDLFKFVSSQSKTNITYTCKNTITGNIVTNYISLQNVGDFQQVTTSSYEFCSIDSNQPIMVVQILMSKDVNDTSDASDSSMILIPPIAQYSSEHVFAVHDYNPDSKFGHIFMFIVDGEQKNNLQMDGTSALSGVTYTEIPNTGLVAGYMHVSTGFHVISHLSSSAAFSGILYGKKTYESYTLTTSRQMLRINKKCSSSTGSPGDGIDNDCDGMIDEDVCKEADGVVSSKFICERNTETIDCQFGYTMHIIYANYGRTSSTTCGSHSRTNCYGQAALEIVKNACQSRSSCTLSSSNSIFGDPCGGVEKYLEVQYKCIPDDSDGDGISDNDCSSIAEASVSPNKAKYWEVLVAEFSILVEFTVYNVTSGNIGLCGRLCFEYDYCRSFTFHHVTKRCVGYTKNYMNYDPIHNIVLDRSKFTTSDEYFYYSPSILENHGFVVDKNTSIAYKFHETAKTKADADYTCALEDSRLLMVHTRDILNTLITAISSNKIPGASNARLFVAGRYNKGRWEFWNDQEVPSELWDASNPNEAVGHCVIVTISGLKSHNCVETRPFLCGK